MASPRKDGLRRDYVKRKISDRARTNLTVKLAKHLVSHPDGTTARNALAVAKTNFDIDDASVWAEAIRLSRILLF